MRKLEWMGTVSSYCVGELWEISQHTPNNTQTEGPGQEHRPLNSVSSVLSAPSYCVSLPCSMPWGTSRVRNLINVLCEIVVPNFNKLDTTKSLLFRPFSAKHLLLHCMCGERGFPLSRPMTLWVYDSRGEEPQERCPRRRMTKWQVQWKQCRQWDPSWVLQGEREFANMKEVEGKCLSRGVQKETM